MCPSFRVTRKEQDLTRGRANSLRLAISGLAKLTEGITGFTATPKLPTWHRHLFLDREAATPHAPKAVVFADCFNRYFEPGNLRATLKEMEAAEVPVAAAQAPKGEKPLCCGRTFLSAGLIKEAKVEAQQLVDALLPHIKEGRPIIGLEPSCLLTLRDEIPALLPDEETKRLAAHARMLEEYIADQHDTPGFHLPRRSPAPKVLLHGHCHQKAMGVMSSIEKTLALLPDTEVEIVETSCCGMAGAFGYGAETHKISRSMAELDLAPAVRKSDEDTLIVADGTSCRHQVADLTTRTPLRMARLLEMALEK